MTEWILIATVALGASALTFFSGFGLGTLLLPAFALLFPIEVAVAATAVVHLVNNLFKLALIGRHARANWVVRFGVPASVAALAGAWLLTRLAGAEPLATWRLSGHTFEISPVGVAVGVAVTAFACVELYSGATRGPRLSTRWVPVGGILSGFFGGLSGHQGALRSAFLARAGLDKEAFIGTGVVCAVLVDVVRLAVYGTRESRGQFEVLGADGGRAVLVATLAAIVGAWVGRRLLRRVTLESVHRIVGVLLLAVGLSLALGVLGTKRTASQEALPESQQERGQRHGEEEPRSEPVRVATPDLEVHVAHRKRRAPRETVVGPQPEETPDRGRRESDARESEHRGPGSGTVRGDRRVARVRVEHRGVFSG